jgi:hypothetical protein
MRAGRLLLVVATLVTIIVFPVLLRDGMRTFQMPNAYAAASTQDFGGRLYQNGNSNNNNDNNNNGNGNGNSNSNSNNNNNNDNNNNGNGNDNSNNNNDNSNNNGNSNNNNDNSFDNGNGNSNDNGNANDNSFVPPPPPPPPPSSSGGSSNVSNSRCFGAHETGLVHIDVSGGSVNVRVVPDAPLPQGTRIELDAVDPATVPAPTGGATFLDNFVWQMQATSPCDGGSVSTLPGAVNLAIPYTITANKSKLQIVLLRNGAWEEVPTVPDPDPNHPYISATIHDTGTYAVIQKP